MLKDALAKFKPEETVKIGDPSAELDPKDLPEGWRSGLPRAISRPAKGGLVLYVTRKAPDLPEEPTLLPKNLRLADYQLHRKALLVDRIWAGKEETSALCSAEFPDRLQKRIAAHVGYVMSSKVKSMDVTLRDECLSGLISLENGERCEALGFISAKDGTVSRFELIVKGAIAGAPADGSGFPRLATLLPEGKKTTAAIAFMLADPGDELSRVQPGSGHDLGGGQEK
jgi:hypothetical protein